MNPGSHDEEQDRPDWDAIIVGGGPAGLSGALLLGRCRRRVLVIDEGKPRNAASKALHGYLSRDGISPHEFLEEGRRQLQKYPCVEIRDGHVTEIRRGDQRFTVIGRDGAVHACRMLLLATGLVDVLPEIEGIGRFYGKSVHHCPFCDGWEHQDEPLAVLGSDKAALALAEELTLWTDDIVLCTNGKEASAAVRERLGVLGIRVDERKIARLEGEGTSLEVVRFVEGPPLPRRAMFFSPGQFQRADFAEKLGCKLLDGKPLVECNPDASTSVPGVYVVGNSSAGVQLVIAAAAEGMQAAVAINKALLEADLTRRVAERERGKR